MKKKILALCLVVVLVATAITGATLAYFTDYTENVTNTFTVGKVDIKLDEDDNTKDGNERTESGNKYEDIYPGVELAKDPTVTVLAGSEESYVRMFVTVDIATLKLAFPQDDNDFASYWVGDVFLLQNLVDWNPDIWNFEKAENGVYEFRYYKTVAEVDTDTKLEPLFTKITVPGEMTNEQISKLENFQVIIKAEAIQADTFADADEAWTAFIAEKAA